MRENKTDEQHTVSQEEFFDNFDTLAGELLSGGDISLGRFEEKLTEAYSRMTGICLENVCVWQMEDRLKCVVTDYYNEILWEREIPQDTSGLLLKYFGKELADEALDRKVSETIDRMSGEIDTLIGSFARSSSVGGFCGILKDIARKLEEKLCQEVPEAAGRIKVSVQMQNFETLECLAAVDSDTPYVIAMDKAQMKKAVMAVQERVEELYQEAKKAFLLRIGLYIERIAERPDIDLEDMQRILIRMYKDRTAGVDLADDIVLFVKDGYAGYMLFERHVIADCEKLSGKAADIIMGKFGNECRRNGEEYAEELEEYGWKREG